MRKLLLVALSLGVLIVGASAMSQTGEFRTLTVSTTADAIIDSSITAAGMDGKRLFINQIWLWYDNAANTNAISLEVVRGQSAIATQGLRREARYTEAMTSGGIKGISIPMNLTTGADSTIYFSLAATGSDSLLMVVNYKLVGK